MQLEQPMPLLTAEEIAANQFQDLLRTFQHIVVKELTGHNVPVVPVGKAVH